MSPRATRRPSSEALIQHLGGPSADPLLVEIAGWLETSPAFRSFVDRHRDKVRKKLRTTADADARRDLRAELAVARLLVGDRRLELSYEPGGMAGGPDFAVTYRGSLALQLEVTHPRAGAHAGAILTKLRQLPPSTPHVVLIATDEAAADADALDETVRALRRRADAKDEAYFTSRGFSGTRAFYDRFLRLGAIIAWAETADAEHRVATWVNRSARIPAPADALRACGAALRSTD